MLSAMFNQLPPNGVYNGRIPCDSNHTTKAGVLCPARLSSTNNNRNGGNSSGKGRGLFNPCRHRSHSCRDAWAVGGTAGNAATISDNSSCNQPCNTLLVHDVTPWTRTWPVA